LRLLVVHQCHLAAATGHADHVELRAVGEGRGRHDGETSVGRNRIERLPDHVQLGVGHAAQDLRGSRRVELREIGEEQDADMDGVSHGVPFASSKVDGRV
jgi:hypothetical protein